MHMKLVLVLALSLVSLLVAACSLPVYGGPLATPTILVLPTLITPPPTIAPAVPATATNTPNSFPTLSAGTGSTLQAQQPASANFCADGQATALITSFKSALQSANGTLLASLVSPVHGMDARFYRNGRTINYDSEHAKFLFDTTFVVDWGSAPGSGLATKGSFHELFVPALLNVFNKNYTLTCDNIQVGGTTYQATWPYPGINFYSVFYPGSQGNGSLDWHTWLIGMDYTNANPRLYAIMQFIWEP